MIHWHKHHIVPKHAGGTDDPSNLLKCNIAMHAFMHEQRYRELGEEYDLIAARGLKGSITKAEANRQATIAWHKANPEQAKVKGKKASTAAAKWAENNPEQVKVNMKKAHATVSEWIKNNPEQAKINRKKANAAAVEWAKDNPEQAKIRAKKAGIGATKWTAENPELARARSKKAAAGLTKKLSKPVTTPKGTFATTKEAAEAHGITMGAAGSRIRRGTHGWFRPTGE